MKTFNDLGAAVAARRMREAMKRHRDFEVIGKRMLLTWAEAVRGLRDKRIYGLPARKPGTTFSGFSDPPKVARLRRQWVDPKDWGGAECARLEQLRAA